MKKTTLKNKTTLSKRLAKYGALIAAIAGVADASGQIVYTDVNPDFAGGGTVDYNLDLNNDGTSDFIIDAYGLGFLYLIATNGNEALGSISSNFFYPFALSSGAVISSGQTTWKSNFGTLNFSTCSFGNWCNETDKYLGLRFVVSGNTHYGWARLDTQSNGNFTVKDYAYNSTPYAAITAGQTTLSVTNQALQQIQITALNKTIALQHLPEAVSYKLYALTGQVVLQGETANNAHVIEAKNQANGVYILELSSNGKTITKKVIL